jgi:hypothetical protein
MIRMQSAIIASMIMLCVAQPSDAQLFRKLQQQQSQCPAGTVCPANATSSQWMNRDGLSPQAHLEQVHGISTAGMSYADVRAEQNRYHNQYGAGHPVRGTVSRAIQVAAVPLRMAASAVSTSYPAASYGSTGMSYGSSGSGYRSVASYGSSGSLAVGQRDHDGAVISSIGAVQSSESSSEASNPPAMESRKDRKSSRAVILESVAMAEAEGSLSSEQAKAIRRATLRPRQLAQIEALIVEKAQIEGYALPMGSDGEVQMKAIAWGDIADFIVKIAPIIFKLIELFASDVDQQMGEVKQFVQVQPLPQAYPEEWYQAA